MEYQYLATLGEGNTASVHLARRRSDGQLVALKRFKAPKYEAHHHKMQVLAELYVTSGLQHRNIIQTFDLLHLQGSWAISMEYIPHNLFDKVLSRSLSLQEIDSCLAQITAAVTYIHASGFAHRDLKLENVLLNDHGQVKVIDFGTVATGKTVPTGDVHRDPVGEVSWLTRFLSQNKWVPDHTWHLSCSLPLTTIPKWQMSGLWRSCISV